MKLANTTKNLLLAQDALIASTPFFRMKGLLGRKTLNDGEALVIRPCNSIHTFFMRFAIDVLFLDRQNKVIAMLNNVLPWRVSPVYWRGYSVVELPSGVIKKSETAVGDEIILL